MKNIIALILIMTFSVIAFANVERFFIGKIEVSRQDFMDVDSTLIRAKEAWSSDDTCIYSITPDIYAQIDSLTQPGRIIVTRKSEAEIALIDSLMNAYRSESSKLNAGDILPEFTLIKYISEGNDTLSGSSLKGKVLLLNFWATWCGPCIEELKPAGLPSIASQFSNDERFVFLPVSVNHSRDEIERFFNTPVGKELQWLKYKTSWDKNGEFADILSKGVIPLTLLIDSEGIIRLNESGAFLSETDLTRLKNEITKLLK